MAAREGHPLSQDRSETAVPSSKRVSVLGYNPTGREGRERWKVEGEEGWEWEEEEKRTVLPST